ncbi:MAG: SPFH/Band 7/PHB domain protein [Anaerolineales bacterium]|jgi:regulator of protease activity HflC (stomatin/prohibitin superfamily)|nr:SPFH/Band 7/PHB domain protein [Anaerolineales bacterium]
MLFSGLSQTELLGGYGSVLCLIGAVVIIAVAILASAIRIIPEYQRLVVFRLGRCVGTKGPGFVLLIPFVDRGVKADLREQLREIPHQTAITKDNAGISIDFIWYYRILDPTESILQVGDFESAAQGMATTTLRAVIGGILLDDVLAEREHINNLLRTRLDEVTERWGVKVTNVEIREIIPPREIQDAMNRQMSAERDRRARVTESTGQREAEINVAQGDRQAAILRAEGLKQSNILVAEGEREAQLLRAEGYAAALEKIYNVAETIDHKTMTLQYFETLKEMGQSPSTTYIFPLEFTRLIESFISSRE